MNQSTTCPLANAASRIMSLEKNAASGGTPAIARQPTRNVQRVVGSFAFRLPILWMSSSPDIACITLPAPRKSSALKQACVIRWNTPPENEPTPTPSTM